MNYKFKEEEGYFRLLGLNEFAKDARPGFISDLVIGKIYKKVAGDIGFNFIYQGQPCTKARWNMYSWKRVTEADFSADQVIVTEEDSRKPVIFKTQHKEDSHESLTFGPLSSDVSVNPKKMHGAVKAPFHASPELAMIQMANVMAGGGWKYGDFNYHTSDVDAMTYLSAIRRHILLWKDGVDTDEDDGDIAGSGQSHLAHVMACCAILIETQAMGKMQDNRPKTGLVAAALKKSSDTFGVFMSKVKQIGK